MSKIISKENISSLVKGALDKGYRVVGPARRGDIVLLSELRSGDQICLDEINPRNSIKEFFFPKSEKIFSFKLKQKDVEIEEQLDFPKTLIMAKYL